MKRFNLFVAAMVVFVITSSNTQAGGPILNYILGKNPNAQSTCQNGTCEVKSGTCQNGTCNVKYAAPVQHVASNQYVNPNQYVTYSQPQSVVIIGSNSVFYGKFVPGMWVTLENGKLAQIVSVSESTPNQTSGPIRMPEPKPVDSKPKAPKNNG